MKTILALIIFLSISLTARTQQQVNGWNYVVDLPAGYNSQLLYPTLIFFPGLGEVGADTNKLVAMGPTRYLRAGGSIPGFIVISLQPPAAWPTEFSMRMRITALCNLFAIDTNRINLTGLSMGGWCSSTYVSGGYPNIRSVITVQGVKPEDNQPYPQVFAAYRGKFLCFEQRNDGRDGNNLVNYINSVHPGNAQFIETNYGSGGHCCFQRIYDGTKYNIFGKQQSIYEWLTEVNMEGVLALPEVPQDPVPVDPVRYVYNRDHLTYNAKGRGKMHLYNSIGQKLIEFSYKKGHNKFYLGWIPSGFYFVKTEFDSYKFIKN